jgi:hypothetical protein
MLTDARHDYQGAICSLTCTRHERASTLWYCEMSAPVVARAGASAMARVSARSISNNPGQRKHNRLGVSGAVRSVKSSGEGSQRHNRGRWCPQDSHRPYQQVRPSTPLAKTEQQGKEGHLGSRVLPKGKAVHTLRSQAF